MTVAEGLALFWAAALAVLPSCIWGGVGAVSERHPHCYSKVCPPGADCYCNLCKGWCPQ